MSDRSRISTHCPVGVIVMGVSGSGKSSIGRTLAKTEGWPFLEGDDLHPPGNIARMRAGLPLRDADRAPWLAAVRDWIASHLHEGHSAVAACSALKRDYRDVLRQAGALRFICLSVPTTELARRMQQREHFMPASLLDSQLSTLELPGPDENALVLQPAAPDELVARARQWLAVTTQRA
ncbi:gluconokinase [Dyella sp. A6]|uniref:gluconokinase n=1 Tax=Dyella aluminiiresistens TaxID=3069105 RepID=UPI002E7A7B7A|nr:gluconokinase [Dyella sp. A6]